MNDDGFWQVIAAARREVGDDREAHTEAVKRLLMGCPSTTYWRTTASSGA